jgi:hypothetical protein
MSTCRRRNPKYVAYFTRMMMMILAMMATKVVVRAKARNMIITMTVIMDRMMQMAVLSPLTMEQPPAVRVRFISYTSLVALNNSSGY